MTYVCLNNVRSKKCTFLKNKSHVITFTHGTLFMLYTKVDINRNLINSKHSLTQNDNCCLSMR